MLINSRINSLERAADILADRIKNVADGIGFVLGIAACFVAPGVANVLLSYGMDTVTAAFCYAIGDDEEAQQRVIGMAISGAIDGVVGARGVCDDILETAYSTGIKSIDFDDGFKGFDLDNSEIFFKNANEVKPLEKTKVVEEITDNLDDVVDDIGDNIAKSSNGIAKGNLKTIDTGNLKVIETKSPNVANDEWLANGYDKPPYDPDFEVKVVEAGETEYVRVFSYNTDGTSNKCGGWLVKKSDIEGLTPSQIADKYALPKEPTHICDIKLDSDFNLQTGIANSVEGWGKGGGQQFDTMGKLIDEEAFINERLIGE